MPSSSCGRPEPASICSCFPDRWTIHERNVVFLIHNFWNAWKGNSTTSDKCPQYPQFSLTVMSIQLPGETWSKMIQVQANGAHSCHPRWELNHSLTSDNLTVSYWKLPVIVFFSPFNMRIIHSYVSLPEGITRGYHLWFSCLTVPCWNDYHFATHTKFINRGICRILSEQPSITTTTTVPLHQCYIQNMSHDILIYWQSTLEMDNHRLASIWKKKNNDFPLAG